MNRTAELWYEHDVLRGKLAALEAFLPALYDAPCTLARLTDSLAVCLRAHTDREECFLDDLTHQLDAPPTGFLQQLHDEHENQRMRLAILHELLTQLDPSPEQVAVQACYLIKDLREHMAREE